MLTNIIQNNKTSMPANRSTSRSCSARRTQGSRSRWAIGGSGSMSIGIRMGRSGVPRRRRGGRQRLEGGHRTDHLHAAHQRLRAEHPMQDHGPRIPSRRWMRMSICSELRATRSERRSSCNDLRTLGRSQTINYRIECYGYIKGTTRRRDASMLEDRPFPLKATMGATISAMMCVWGSIPSAHHPRTQPSPLQARRARHSLGAACPSRLRRWLCGRSREGGRIYLCVRSVDSSKVATGTRMNITYRGRRGCCRWP